MKHTRKLLILIGGFLPLFLFSQNKIADDALAAADFMASFTKKIVTLESVNTLENNNQKLDIFQISGSGWVMMDAMNSKVIGFNDKGVFDVQKSPLFGESKLMAVQTPLQVTSSIVNNANKSVADGDTVYPFFTDTWGGTNQWDSNNNVVHSANYYTPEFCSPGCVAIATAQILNYYEWPNIGEGNNIYSDNFNGNTLRHQAFFDNTQYDWGNMLDFYQGITTTTAQQQAIGKLMFDTAIAYEMNFEPAGSSSNINKGPVVLKNFFRYSAHYESVSWQSFWSRMYENIQDHIPVAIAVTATSNGSGHVIVANGYENQGGNPFYFINWGWWNSGGENGWYNIQAWNGTGSNYNQVDGALFDAVPVPKITSITTTGNGNDFNIHWEVSSRKTPEQYTLERKKDNEAWVEVSNTLTTQDYVYANPTGSVYQFRVKAKTDGLYYADSWSEIAVHAVNGTYNGYAVFEGSQYAYARQTPEYDLNFTNDYTFETWIKVKGNNQSGDVIFDKQESFSLYITDVTSTNYSVVFKSYANTTDLLESATTGAKLNLNQWNHIAVSKTGNTARLFINGQQRDINTTSVFYLQNSLSSLNIGEKYTTAYSNFILADMDNIRFSNIGRYTADFSPNRNDVFTIDSNTKGYFTFENIHKIRFKDHSFEQSVIVKNETGNVTWNYDFIAGTASNEELQVNDWGLVFPNPTSNEIQIQLIDTYNTEGLKYYLYDTTGKLLDEKPVNFTSENHFSIDLTPFVPDIYLLKFTNNSIYTTIKIIKH